MPNRIIRDSALASHKLDQVSGEAERLYWRLLLIADDFGRFRAEPSMLIARCFPLRVHSVSDRTMKRWHGELVSAGLILSYSVNGDLLGQFVKWTQTVRAKESRFPDPPMIADDRKCSQMIADAPVVGDVDVDVDERRETVRPLNAGPSCAECHAALEELNRQTGRHYTGSGEGLRMLHARHQEHGMPAVLRVIRVKVGAWLRQPKWSKYLRPETLFRPSKFDGYLNEPDPAEETDEDSLPPLRLTREDQ